jgi:hypothetical protein
MDTVASALKGSRQVFNKDVGQGDYGPSLICTKLPGAARQ